jgi:hypothetical protein
MVQTAIPSLAQSARGDGAAAITATAKIMKTIRPFLVIARPPVVTIEYAGRILERMVSRAIRRQKH